jgi:hypothetical protein
MNNRKLAGTDPDPITSIYLTNEAATSLRISNRALCKRQAVAYARIDRLN